MEAESRRRRLLTPAATALGRAENDAANAPSTSPLPSPAAPTPPLPTADPGRWDADRDSITAREPARSGRAPPGPRGPCAGKLDVPSDGDSGPAVPVLSLPQVPLLPPPRPRWSGVERALGSMSSAMPAAAAEIPLHRRWLSIATRTKAACRGPEAG
jgi:hypothetical protein